MKKTAIIFLCFITFCCLGLYFTSSLILEKLSDKALDYLSANLKTQNFSYSRPTFRRVALTSLNAVTWEDVAMNVSLVRHDEGKTENIALTIGNMTVSLNDFFQPAVFFEANNISTQTTETGNSSNLMQTPVAMEDGQFDMPLILNGFSKAAISEQIHTVKEEMKRFAKSGVTKLPIDFSATAKFEIQGKPCVAKFSIQQEGKESQLVMDKNDLQNIISLLTDSKKPNPAEIDIISHHPLKASTLIKIRDKAAAAAQLAAKKNPQVPEDAYRHTLWSYLLTKRYGAEFAKQVTDAHETAADEEELMNEADFSVASYQDLVNNAQGRQYAKMKYREADILEKVLTDPAIIKDNEAHKRFDLLDYENLKPPVRHNSLF